MEACTFCEIVAGRRDAHVLDETDRTVTFLDDYPAVTGHTLVLPKSHVEELFEEDSALLTDLSRAVQRVVTAIDRTLEPDGVSTFYTSGELAGTISHAHVHLLPRYEDDDVGFALPRGSLDDGDPLAERLRSSIDPPE